MSMWVGGWGGRLGEHEHVGGAGLGVHEYVCVCGGGGGLGLGVHVYAYKYGLPAEGAATDEAPTAAACLVATLEH